MRITKGIICLSILLGLAGCEIAADPDTLTGTYRSPDSQETLTLRKDGTAILRNKPGSDGNILIKWSLSKRSDQYDCTWINFEPLDEKGVE